MDYSRSWLHGLRYLVFGLIALCAFAPETASAVCTGSPHSYTCDDEGEAYAKAHSIPIEWCSSSYDRNEEVIKHASQDRYIKRYQYWGCGQSGFWFTAGWANWTGGDCSTRPIQEGGWLFVNEEGANNSYCHNGCGMMPAQEAPIEGSVEQMTWFPTGDTCAIGEGTVSPINDADADGVPDEEDAFPDDPDESEDTDEDGMGDNEDFAPEDATDGADDGEGNESDNQAGGGGTCAAPPSCGGDGIACATLFQQWRTRCAVERMAGIENGGVTVGGGNTPGNGTGDGEGEDEGTDWGEGDGSTVPEEVVTIDSDILDMDGFMGAGSCPTWGPIQILGESYALPQVHCDILEWIGFLVVAVALVVAARIIGS